VDELAVKRRRLQILIDKDAEERKTQSCVSSTCLLLIDTVRGYT